MALIPDYDAEDERDALRSGGAIRGMGSSSPSAPQSASPAPPNKDSAFVPWERFVSANKEVSEREAGKLQNQTRSSISQAITGREQASEAQARGVESNYATRPVGGATASATAFGGQDTAFGQPQQPDGATAAQVPQVGVDITGKRELTAKTRESALGAPNLEAQLGSDKWMSLIQDTAKAQNEAKSLGSEGGIQALLAKQYGDASAMDAALTGAAGGQGFRDLAKEFGGDKLSKELVGANQSAMDRWQSLMGEIQDAGAAQAQAQTGATGPVTDEQKARDAAAIQAKIDEHLNYLNREFPMLAIATSKETLLDWMNKNARATGAEHGAQVSWANSIYGRDALERYGEQGLITKLYQDIQKMTPAEFAMFAQGLVPSWMGLGQAAMGINGGFWWGFRNTNTKVGGASVKDITNMSQEDKERYQNYMKALATLYQVLGSIATGAAYMAGGPLAGGLVGAGVAALLAAQGEATGAKQY